MSIRPNQRVINGCFNECDIVYSERVVKDRRGHIKLKSTGENYRVFDSATGTHRTVSFFIECVFNITNLILVLKSVR